MKKTSKLRLNKINFVSWLLLILTFHSFAQDSAPPDSPYRNRRPASGKELDFNEIDLGFTTARVGAAFMNDWAWYSQDAEGKAQLDSANVELKDQSKWRDARIFFSGKIKSKRYLEWRVAMMWDGIEEEFTFRETGLIIGVPELSGKIFIGRSKVGVSSSKVGNGYARPTIERQPALDPIPIMADEIRYFGATKKSNLFWSLGYSNNLFYGSGSRFYPYDWVAAARFGWLPLYKPEQNTLIHLGVNFSYFKPNGDKIQVKSKPESNPAPNFIDTKTFDCDKATVFGPELYFYSGPMMIGSESFVYNYQSKQAGNPTFWGGNILITYNLTGESYPYIKDNATSYFIEPKKSIYKGGIGCWQILFAGTKYDTNDGLMPGGSMWKLTGMLNWYPSNDFAIKFMYGYGELNRFGIIGATQYFQTRFQFNLM